MVRQHPVTNVEYLAFLNDLIDQGRDHEAETWAPHAPPKLSMSTEALVTRAGRGHLRLTHDERRRPLHDTQPVRLISWQGAHTFARWLADRTGQPWRLPSELEWEKLARGVDGRDFVWGNHLEAGWANILGATPDDPSPCAVTAHRRDESIYGVCGLTGHVRDFCGNRWTLEGPRVTAGYAHPDEALLDEPGLRSMRGGCWHNTEALCRTASRFAGIPTQSYPSVGFRLVRPLVE